MLIKLPRIDRKASLLAGFEVGPVATVEVDLSTLGEDRTAVIEALDLHNDGTATLPLAVSTPTVESIVAAVRGLKAKEAEAEAERRAILDKVVVATAMVNGLEPVPGRRTLRSENGFTILGEYDGWIAPEYEKVYSYSAEGLLHTPEWEAYRAAQEALLQRVETADAPARAAAQPLLQAQHEERERERREAWAAEAAAKEKARAERAARRLATGYWERDTPPYNPRRWSKPWCARVTGVDSRGRLVYAWGEWTGRHGEAGLLRAGCKPGEIVAWGQKDSRGNKGEHTLARMAEDGRMETLSVVEAAKALRDAV